MKLRTLALILTGGLPLTTGFSQTTFSDVTVAAGIQLQPGSNSLAVGDFNNDGWDDLYIGYVDRKNQLYKNNGDGTYTELAQAAGVDVGGKTAAAVWGDINNDGFPDLYVANQLAPDKLFLNRGDETFQDISFTSGAFQTGHPMAVNMADVNGDGFLDIYVSNFLQENVLYRNNKNNTFTNIIYPSRALDTGKSMGAVFFDYDKDGDADLYLVHDGNEPNFLYQNDGKGVFTEVAQAAGANTASFGMGVDAGDVDNDGFADLYITNLFENILLRNNGDGTFSDISESAGVDDYGMGWGVTFLDYDNDGWLDVYAVNDHAFSPYPNVLYRNLGNLTFERVETDGPVSNKDDSYGTACLDFNHDGNVDLVVANRSNNEYPQLFQNGLRSGYWIGMKLVGVQSNRSAVGAKIRILDNLGVLHYKELAAGHGWASQNSGVLHVGLGNANEIQSLTIYWPSGLEQVVDPLPVNNYYTIEEGEAPRLGLSGSVSTSDGFSIDPALFSCTPFPNPVTGDEICLDLNLPASSAVRLELLSQAGVPVLARLWPDMPAGRSVYCVPFDGNLFPADGLYYLRLISGDRISESKVMVLKK